MRIRKIALTSLLVLGAGLYLLRVRLPRRPGTEGIDDPQVAEAYNRMSQWPQFYLLRLMIMREVRRHQPHGVLADLGCGPGYLALLLARKFPHVHILGIDLSSEMVRLAGARARSLGLAEKVEFVQGDIENLPLRDDGLDFALSSLSLHHWSDPKRVLTQIHRVLKRGGQFLIFDLRRDCRLFFYLLLNFAQRFVVPSPLRRIKEPGGSLWASYTKEEVEEILRGSPFSEWSVKAGSGWMFIWGRKT